LTIPKKFASTKKILCHILLCNLLVVYFLSFAENSSNFLKLKLISDMNPQTLKRPTEDVYSSGTYIVQSEKECNFPGISLY